MSYVLVFLVVALALVIAGHSALPLIVFTVVAFTTWRRERPARTPRP